MGRPKTFTAASVLDQAIILFRQHGYHNTSMQTIADHLGISRSSIYATFNDKNELLEQALLHYGATFRVPGLPDLHDTATPRAALLRVFGLTGASGEPCLLINTALKLGRCTPVVATVLEAAFEDLVTRFREAIERAQATHEIAAGVDAAQTARFLLALYLGLCVLVRAGVREPGTRAVLRQVQSLLPENGGA